MKRRAFTISAAGSLLIFSFVLLLWVRSHLTADVLRGDRATAVAPATIDRRMFTVVSGGGGVLLHASRTVTADPRVRAGPPTGHWIVQSKQDPREARAIRNLRRQWLGFGFDSGRSNPTDRLTTSWSARLAIPYWFLVLCAAALPLAWLRWRVAVVPRLRAVRGLCPGCGYDLRASPNCCPECGAVVTAPAKSEHAEGATRIPRNRQQGPVTP